MQSNQAKRVYDAQEMDPGIVVWSYTATHNIDCCIPDRPEFRRPQPTQGFYCRTNQQANRATTKP